MRVGTPLGGADRIRSSACASLLSRNTILSPVRGKRTVGFVCSTRLMLQYCTGSTSVLGFGQRYDVVVFVNNHTNVHKPPI